MDQGSKAPSKRFFRIQILPSDCSEGRILVVCANWILITCDPQFRPGEEVTFEVQEADASLLKVVSNCHEQYAMDSGPLFWAELTSLKHCPLSSEAFCFLGRPRLRVVLTVRLAH